MDLASGKTFKIATTDVLSATTLGSGVLASSLTSVGTLTSLSVAGATTLGTSYNATDGSDKVKINGALHLGVLDGDDATQQDILEYLATNAAGGSLNGQMVYVTNAYPTGTAHKARDDFDTDNKFYSVSYTHLRAHET